MWRATARAQYDAVAGIYPSSMSAAEWALIAPDFPSPRADGSRGYLRDRDMLHPMRRIVDAIFRILRNGVPWRSLPANAPDLP
jgi:transposase